jgi:hypothetical protein
MTRVFVYPSVRPPHRPDVTAERPLQRPIPRRQRELVRESLLLCPDTEHEGSER